MTDYDPNYVPKKTYALVGQKAILLNRENKILLLQRSEKSGAGRKWSLPGGGLEDKEEPFSAIKREIKEETKLEVKDIKPFNLRSYTYQNDFILIVGYVCSAIDENVVLNWEHDNYKWLTTKEALKLELTDDARYFVEVFSKE